MSFLLQIKAELRAEPSFKYQGPQTVKLGLAGGQNWALRTHNGTTGGHHRWAPQMDQPRCDPEEQQGKQRPC